MINSMCKGLYTFHQCKTTFFYIYFMTASKPKKTERKRWSKEEEDELKKLFKANFEKDCCPKQLEIEKIMKKSREKGGLIHLRPRDNIKKKVSGMLVKMRKKKDG